MGTVKRKRSMSITDISEIQPVKGPVVGLLDLYSVVAVVMWRYV